MRRTASLALLCCAACGNNLLLGQSAVQASPSASQYVTQPDGTSLIVTAQSGGQANTPSTAPLQVHGPWVSSGEGYIQTWGNNYFDPSQMNFNLSSFNGWDGIDYRFTRFFYGVRQPLLTFNAPGESGFSTFNPQNTVSINGGLTVDQDDSNDGTNMFAFSNIVWSRGMTFGDSSGEGIGSARINGSVNQYGLDFYTGFVKRLSLTSGGYLGIGTATPSAPLEVNGNVQIDGSLNVAGTVNASQGLNLNTGQQGINVNLNAGVDPSTYNTLSFNTGYGPVSWGATSNPLNGWGTTIWSWQPNNSNNGANLAFATGNGTTISPNSNIRMLIDSSGNVGIGTNKPQAMLDVAGNIRISGSGSFITFPDGTIQSTAYAGNTCSAGGGSLGPAAAPTGSCSTNGMWVFSQDGHATFCGNGTWISKI